MIWLIAGLVVFLGIHSTRMVAPDFRARMIARFGENGWKGIYSLVALAGLVLLVWGYGQARMTAPVVYEPPEWMKHLTMALMPFSLIALAASQLPAGYIKRALKHPMLVAVKIWAFAHLLANGDLASIVLFVAVLAWAVWNRISVKRRGPVEFGAVSAVYDVVAVAIGIALTVWLVVQLHGWLFGVPLAA